MAFCHCTKCRQASGSAFAVNGRVRASDVSWPAGRETIREYESTPGKLRAFCSACGSPIYARTRSEPESISIRMGLVAEDPGIRPDAHYNVGSKAPWFTVTDGLVQYPEDTDTDPISPTDAFR
jgi:hypothetical protein